VVPVQVGGSGVGPGSGRGGSRLVPGFRGRSRFRSGGSRFRSGGPGWFRGSGVGPGSGRGVPVQVGGVPVGSGVGPGSGPRRGGLVYIGGRAPCWTRTRTRRGGGRRGSYVFFQ
jgi:hypothetical protein